MRHLLPMMYGPCERPVHDAPPISRPYRLLGGQVVMGGAPSRDRPAVDALLLAAATPAAPGMCVLDVGCGTGAVGLCAAARQPAVRFAAIDISADAVAQARANAELNGWADRFEFHRTDLADYRHPDGFDVVSSNPPYNDRASSRAPDLDRDLARFGVMPLQLWLRHCLRLCRPRGRLVVILRADRTAQALAALDEPAGDLRILPIHPKGGAPAIRVLIHARKSVRTPARLLAGLVLHEAGGAWTAAACRLLREGAAIDWERGEVIR